MRIRLTIISGPDGSDDAVPGVDFFEAGGLIGRSLACDWVLDRSDQVSRWHARILFFKGNFYILDTSLNGVFLNDNEERIGRDKQARLNHGDRIRIGDYLIGVEIEQELAETRIESVQTPPAAVEPEPAAEGNVCDQPPDESDRGAHVDLQVPAFLRRTKVDRPPRVEIDYPVDERSDPPIGRAQAEQALEAYENSARQHRGSEAVDFAVFGPRRIEPSKPVMIDVWAYPHGDFARVRALAAELDREQVHGRKTGMVLTRGTVIVVELTVRGAKVMTPVDRLVWEGVPTNISFAVLVPEDCAQESLIGAALLTIDGIPAGNVVFTIEIGATADPSPSDCDHRWLPMRSAFASYTYEDRAEVFARLQGIVAISPQIDIFMDVLSLRAGDDWGERLSAEIPSKDRFLLFWSKTAAASAWVEREWRLALARRGLPYIKPVPLQDPRQAPPPEALRSLHFNDAFLAHIEYQRARHIGGDRSG